MPVLMYGYSCATQFPTLESIWVENLETKCQGKYLHRTTFVADGNIMR